MEMTVIPELEDTLKSWKKKKKQEKKNDKPEKKKKS